MATATAPRRKLASSVQTKLLIDGKWRDSKSGQTFETIRLTLEQHGTRAVPPAVLDSLRTWANKRERITVFPSATLLEVVL